jgi:hypothetical protein
VLLDAHRELVRLPGVGWQAVMGLVAQLTQGAAAIGIVLVVRGHTGSLALAGVVVGGLSIAAGLSRPLQGRLISRRGAAGVMAVCGVVHGAALLAASSAALALVTVAALAGASAATLATLTRRTLARTRSALPAIRR